MTIHCFCTGLKISVPVASTPQMLHPKALLLWDLAPAWPLPGSRSHRTCFSPTQLEGFPFHLLFPSLLFQATNAFLKLSPPYGLLAFRKPKPESFCFSSCHLPPRSKGHTDCYLLKWGIKRRTSNSFDMRQKCRLQGQLMWRRK